MIRREAAFLLRGFVGVAVILAAVLYAAYGAGLGPVLATLAARSSQLLTGAPGFSSLGGGFSANILVSLVAMTLAICGGTALGVGLVAQSAAVRRPCSLVMNLLRNSPWLVVLYAMLYVLPFEIAIGRTIFTFSPFLKASVGLALPVAANFAELFRGGVQAVPATQWEAARSLGYRRTQILRHVILPQAIPMMVPNIMSLYAALFIGSSLIVVTGTLDVLAIARTIVATEGDHIATALYLCILGLFFAFCFPIAVGSRWLEHRLQVRQ